MPQYFGPHWNTIARLTFYGGPVLLGLAGVAAALFVRSPYWSGRNVRVEQPVPFSHEVHAGRLGLDCRYCHPGSEREAFAGMPATEVCMNCHAHVWTGLPSLEPVRSSLRTGVPLTWLRVHDLPDHAYFHHGIHTQKGIGCAECHGRVDQMPQVWQTQTLYMEWCLECHREPERFVRPRQEVFNLAWQPPKNQRERGLALMAEYRIERKTSCSACHR
jgi:hypothetical protein